MKKLASEYGMLLVLVALCALFSILTIRERSPTGSSGGTLAFDLVRSEFEPGARILIVAGKSADDRQFVQTLETELVKADYEVLESINGTAADVKRSMNRFESAGTTIDAIACPRDVALWGVFDDLEKPVRLSPSKTRSSVFLSRSNLLNVASQISVIAVIAIGMTMVIITAGIDLSVGSLIALSAVVSTLLIQNVGGGVNASVLAMIGCSLAGILCCALVGTFSGGMVTAFRVPPFIVTLAMMLVARGTASLLTGGESVSKIPDSFTWLGVQASLFGLPNSVVLMLVLYVIAHVVMSRTVLGRYLYAVGGNPEAARLSGVPVKRVILFAYLMSGLLAGLGGVMMASQLKSGSPTYGGMYELYVIAAVVVGGTSLAGGEGKIFGTLIGAFIIAVIQNGMNLLKIESFTQDVVLGGVILAAVLLDTLKHRRG
ncbi:MAG TPA: ABC transporter permease [Planctomycetaceae bacterium]|nr:ABC transporter permease [Planctomycetaceae bacterium]